MAFELNQQTIQEILQELAAFQINQQTPSVEFNAFIAASEKWEKEHSKAADELKKLEKQKNIASRLISEEKAKLKPSQKSVAQNTGKTEVKDASDLVLESEVNKMLDTFAQELEEEYGQAKAAELAKAKLKQEQQQEAIKELETKKSALCEGLSSFIAAKKQELVDLGRAQATERAQIEKAKEQALDQLHEDPSIKAWQESVRQVVASVASDTERMATALQEIEQEIQTIKEKKQQSLAKKNDGLGAIKKEEKELKETEEQIRKEILDEISKKLDLEKETKGDDAKVQQLKAEQEKIEKKLPVLEGKYKKIRAEIQGGDTTFAEELAAAEARKQEIVMSCELAKTEGALRMKAAENPTDPAVQAKLAIFESKKKQIEQEARQKLEPLNARKREIEYKIESKTQEVNSSVREIESALKKAREKLQKFQSGSPAEIEDKQNSEKFLNTLGDKLQNQLKKNESVITNGLEKSRKEYEKAIKLWQAIQGEHLAAISAQKLLINTELSHFFDSLAQKPVTTSVAETPEPPMEGEITSVLPAESSSSNKDASESSHVQDSQIYLQLVYFFRDNPEKVKEICTNANRSGEAFVTFVWYSVHCLKGNFINPILRCMKKRSSIANGELKNDFTWQHHSAFTPTAPSVTERPFFIPKAHRYAFFAWAFFTAIPSVLIELEFKSMDDAIETEICAMLSAALAVTGYAMTHWKSQSPWRFLGIGFAVSSLGIASLAALELADVHQFLFKDDVKAEIALFVASATLILAGIMWYGKQRYDAVASDPSQHNPGPKQTFFPSAEANSSGGAPISSLRH